MSPLVPPAPPLSSPSLQAGAMLQRLKGQPLTLRLLRWRWHDGTVFEPLLPYLKALKEKEPHFQLQHSPQHRGEGEPQQLQGGRWVCAMGRLGSGSWHWGTLCPHCPRSLLKVVGPRLPHGLEVRRGLGGLFSCKEQQEGCVGSFL